MGTDENVVTVTGGKHDCFRRCPRRLEEDARKQKTQRILRKQACDTRDALHSLHVCEMAFSLAIGIFDVNFGSDASSVIVNRPGTCRSFHCSRL